MGTKRPFDEDLQEFIKHPKHLENGNKPELFGEDKLPLETSQNAWIPGEGGAKLFHTDNSPQSENVVTAPGTVDQEFKTGAPLPLVTGPGPVFSSNPFSEFFEFNMPRRQLVHYDDTYSSLLNNSPRKEVPIGPDHQANVPEFDPNVATNYSTSVRIHIIPIFPLNFSNENGENANTQSNCNCMDGGSIRCIQQHINESRLKLKESLGDEKFINLGFNEMGEEVSRNWTEDEEQLFHDIIYSNPVSHGKRFWEQLSIAFLTRTKKEIVSYYFNVFMLRRRAVQNRSKLLEIDSDDDEWWGSKRGAFGVKIEDEDFVLVGSFDEQDHESSSSEDGDGETEDNIIIGTNDQEKSSTVIQEDKVTSENENDQEKPLNGGLKSESYLHWDPPYSTMGQTKGVDLLPTCGMIEEIFGSSKNGESS